MKTLPKKKLLIVEDDDAGAAANINELNNKYRLLEIKVAEMAKIIDTLLLEKKDKEDDNGENNKEKRKYIKKKVVGLLLRVDMAVFLNLRYNAKKRV